MKVGEKMTYWLKTFRGEILKGKANSWKEVSFGLPYGAKLYNPYTDRTVIGWNKYKADLAKSQKKKYPH